MRASSDGNRAEPSRRFGPEGAVVYETARAYYTLRFLPWPGAPPPLEEPEAAPECPLAPKDRKASKAALTSAADEGGGNLLLPVSFHGRAAIVDTTMANKTGNVIMLPAKSCMKPSVNSAVRSGRSPIGNPCKTSASRPNI